LTVFARLLAVCLFLSLTAQAWSTEKPTKPRADEKDGEKDGLVEQCPRDMPKRCACIEYDGGIRVVPVLKARKGGAKILWIGPRPKQ
jgi:hypothetical protein